MHEPDRLGSHISLETGATPILNTNKVFIANAGGDEPGIPRRSFSGGPERAYGEFCAAMKN